MSTLQAVYDSEINFLISTFWDGGFTWKLGDEMNGFKAEGLCATLEAAEQALAKAAREAYPESDFARGGAVKALVRDCQKVLAAYLPPDGVSEKQTISALLDLLDGPRSRFVLDGS